MNVTDPVCGMTLKSERAAATVTHEGTVHHFCTEACRAQFVASPTKYLEKTEPD